MDTLTPERRSENMRRIRSRDTSPEMEVRRMVHGMGYRYRLHSPNLPGKPDLTLTRLGKVIFVHGCFWHLHQKCVDGHVPKTRTGYWSPKLTNNAARDERHRQALIQMGWKVLVVWECETKRPRALLLKLRRFLES